MRSLSTCSTSATLSDVEGHGRVADQPPVIPSDYVYKTIIDNLKKLVEDKEIKKEDLPQKHLEQILEHIDLLTQPDPIPKDLEEATDEMIRLGPTGCAQERKRRFDQAMELSRTLRRKLEVAL